MHNVMCATLLVTRDATSAPFSPQLLFLESHTLFANGTRKLFSIKHTFKPIGDVFRRPFGHIYVCHDLRCKRETGFRRT